MEANNKAMREAVRSILNLAYEVAAETEEPRGKISNDWLIETCKAALALPPRNCDVGTAEEQHKRWNAFCTGRGCCSSCPAYSVDADCSIAWAQMPYEEGGAV